MQTEIGAQDIKISGYPDEELSVYGMFKQNHKWEVFEMIEMNEKNIRPKEREEVGELLDYRNKGYGFITFFCETCEEFRTVHLGCNGRLCN